MAGNPTHFELGVDDPQRAQAFYAKLFGWQVHPMGEGAGGWIETGGVRGGLHGGDPDPGIVVYFDVPDLEAALKTVGELGGEPGHASPHEPGFGRFAQCRDDQGTRFGLHEPDSAAFE